MALKMMDNIDPVFRLSRNNGERVNERGIVNIIVENPFAEIFLVVNNLLKDSEKTE